MVTEGITALLGSSALARYWKVSGTRENRFRISVLRKVITSQIFQIKTGCQTADFDVDMTDELMNKLYVKLQCKGLFVHDMYSAVKAFRRKFQLLSSQVKNNILSHLPTLKEAKRPGDHLQKYSTTLEAHRAEFSRRFQDFKTLEWNARGFFCLQLWCGWGTKWSSDGTHWPAVSHTSGRALQVSLTAGLLLLPQREEFSTPEEDCSEDLSPLWIYLSLWKDILSEEVQQIQTQILYDWWPPLSCPSHSHFRHSARSQCPCSSPEQTELFSL